MKYFIIFSSLLLTSCNSNPNVNSVSTPNKDTLLNSRIAIDTLSKSNSQLLPDSVQIKNTILDFLSWYKAHMLSEQNQYKFVVPDAKGMYSIDKKASENYLSFLKSSGQISDQYLIEWRKYFEDRAHYFSENPSNEGPPEGFDMDLVLITQEPELVLDSLNQLHFQMNSNENNKAIMNVTGNPQYNIDYNFEMSKINNKWYIDYIGTMNYD